MWLYPFIFVSAAFLGMGISDFFFFFLLQLQFYGQTASAWLLWLLWLLPLMFLSCSQSVTVVVVMVVVLPRCFFLSYLWLSFWRLVSIGWLCDLPVWLIGLGTYVINLLLFINKPVGQRSFLEGPSCSPLPQLNENFENFHSQFKQRDNRWASMNPWMVNRCSWPDKLLTEYSWLEPVD